MTTETSAEVPADSKIRTAPHLRRVLGMWDLVFYGIVLIQPVGAVGPFGLANKMSLGHVTATILIALVAMMLTAISYGRMAGLYPAAGSAYTYVGRGLNPHLGFLAGWAMFLDYLVIPIVSVVYGALSIQRVIDALAPGWLHGIVATLHLPVTEQRAGFLLWVFVFTALVTLLNLRGIKWTAWANQILTAAMFIVIVIFIVDAARFLLVRQGWSGLFSTEPLYNPRTFNLGAIGTATSLAALTYIGFDGITTLSEDVKEPKRTVPLAIVLTCVVIGVCATLEVYLGQRVWPDYSTFKDLDTAFFDVCELVGGKFLFHSIGLIMAIACLGSALTGQVGAARILFGMGRDNALPRFFARLDRRNNPVLNIWLIGVLVLAGCLLLNYEKAATLINFGAFLAFLGVNAAVIREFFFRPPHGHRKNLPVDLVVPGLGFAFCLWIWLKLPTPAQTVGTIWCSVGLFFLITRHYGLRCLFSFKGRINREGFWLIAIVFPGTILAFWILGGFTAILYSRRNVGLWVIVALLLLLPCWTTFVTSVKRWHDRNKSGWMMLVNFIPIVGVVWSLIELGFLPGTHGPNNYGDQNIAPNRLELEVFA